MTCGGCVRSITNAITARNSAVKVEVDLPTGIVTVEGDLSEDTIKDAVEGAGFDFEGRAVAA